MTYGDLIIKLPRKNLLNLIETEQGKLVKLIEESRRKLKQKTNDLLKLQPELSDMDPYVIKLLLQQHTILENKN